VNSGLIRKTAREMLPMALILGLGLFGVELLFARILPTFYKEFSDSVLKLPFVQKILPAALGLDPKQAIGPAMMMAIVWVHPVVLLLVWTMALWAGTRVPVSEVDRGTIDVLMSLPVSRAGVFCTEAMVGLGAGAVVILMGLAGNAIGGWPLETELVGTVGQRLWVGLNLWALYASVFAMAALTSSMCDRRGRAIGAVVAMVIAAFVVGFLSAYSPLLKKILFLSVLNYYRPLFILQHGIAPVRDVLILFAVGLVFWIVAAIVFARRDIRTV